MIRRPPRSTLDRSSAASDVYKRQVLVIRHAESFLEKEKTEKRSAAFDVLRDAEKPETVSYTHLRAHETVLDLVCRLLLEKKKRNTCLEHSHPRIQPATTTEHADHITL